MKYPAVCLTLALLLLATTTNAAADGMTSQEKLLQDIVERGKAKARAEIQKREKELSSASNSPEAIAARTKEVLSQIGASGNGDSKAASGSRKKTSATPPQPELPESPGKELPPELPYEDDIVTKLSKQVLSLKEKDAQAKARAASTERPRDVKKIGAKTVFNYREGAIYEIHTGVDRITDIELQPGEQLSAPPVAGDTVRWKTSIIKGGKGRNETTHIILKPLEGGIETNLILTTDKHTYHIRALSSDWYVPSVSWNYPQEESPDYLAALQREQSEEPLQISPESMNFSYNISGRSYTWKPLRVFDDGSKTYIQMPPQMKTGEAPVLFITEEGESTLVNYRVKGSYYVVDRLLESAELRVGPDKSVEIERGSEDSFFARLFGGIF